jgi:hypothetical protein
MAYKGKKGYTPYASKVGFSKPGKSPMKFLGKMFGGGKGGKIGGAIGGIVAGPLGALMGNRIGRTGGLSGGGEAVAPPGMSGAAIGGPAQKQAMMAKAGVPMQKREYTPYKKADFSSPLKTDATLVSGARDAATGFGTVKYGITAKSRAFGDMVNTVEDTVNKSSKAQLAKDRRRAKRTVKSHDKYGDWRERHDRREFIRDKNKSQRREARNKWREARGAQRIPDYDYGTYDPTSDHGGGNYGYYWTHDGYRR